MLLKVVKGLRGGICHLLISMPKLNKNALKILILSHHILSVEMPLKVM